MLKSGGWIVPALVVLLGTIAVPCQADTGADLGQRLKDSKAVGVDGGLEVWTLADETIVALDSDARLSEDVLRNRAQEVLRIVAASDGRKGKPLKVVFIDKANRANVQEVSMTADQVTSGTLSSPLAVARGQRTFFSTAAGAIPPIAASLGASSAVLSQGQFQAERTKMISRIQALQSKGVGVKPLFDEMEKVDDQFKKAELDKASDSLHRLDGVVAEHEKALKARVAAQTPAALPQAPGRPLRASAPAQQSWTGLDLSNPNITADSAHEEIARHLLQMELGDLAPSEGPFRLERFRIAEQLKKMQSQGMRIDTYKPYYKKMDELAVSTARDPRRMTQLRDDVIYLQKQVGLGEIQGQSHYHD